MYLTSPRLCTFLEFRDRHRVTSKSNKTLSLHDGFCVVFRLRLGRILLLNDCVFSVWLCIVMGREVKCGLGGDVVQHRKTDLLCKTRICNTLHRDLLRIFPDSTPTFSGHQTKPTCHLPLQKVLKNHKN